MFKNYFKSAFRNIRKNPFNASINIFGLAVGLATCLLILLYVLNELSYDKYNVKAKRIYRINNEIRFGGNYFDLAQSPALMGPVIVKEFPRVEQYVRIQWHGSLLVKKGNECIREYLVAFADSTLFDVFSLPMVSGDPKTALTVPHSLVITETIARKYFNKTDVAGEVLLLNNSESYKITGVIKDMPEESHFRFDFFIPMLENSESRNGSWLNENYNTYIVIKEGTDIKQLDLELNKLMDRNIEPELKSAINISLSEFKKGGSFARCSLTPLTAIHLHSDKTGELAGNGNVQYVYILSAIAIFILMIACINFMNLSTARSANRAREVGIRKVLGSFKKNLITQFLTESVLISFIAMLVAILMTVLILPYFNRLAGIHLLVNSLFHPYMIGSCLLLTLLVGMLAGSYPAFFLSAFQPIQVLKGNLTRGFKGSWLRNGLVIFQFTISIILIVGTVVIYNQLNYIRNKDIGYDRSQVLLIQNTESLKAKATSFKNELLQISGVQNATMSAYLPVNYNRSNDAFFTSPALDQKTAVSMQLWRVDNHYIPALGMKFIAGRNFSPDFLTDSGGIVINEAAAKFLGTNNLLNKKLYKLKDIQKRTLDEFHILGVIKNFHFSSLRDAITPLALCLGNEPAGFALRINTSDIPSVISQVKNKWQAMAPGLPFDYSFMDDDFNKQYDKEQRTGQVFMTFTLLAILIACMGLFGLVAYAAEQRTKEIGIRKVLGASVTGIVNLLSFDFLKLVFIAVIIASPIAWYIMNKWLQDFAYRISISWGVFVMAAILAILVTIVTVIFQAIKAAVANPVKSLRTE